MTTQTALVTGVGGQDGGYLAERLLADGWEVHGTVHPTGGPDHGELTHVPAQVRLHAVDLETPAGIGSLIRELEPTHIYNLAAISSVARSWEVPEIVAAVNGLAVVSMLAATWDLRAAGRDIRLVQASSAEIFGNTAPAPQSERTPVAPANPYGAAKAFAHSSVDIFRKRGLHASNLILFNHESPRRPEKFVSRKITAGVARIKRGLQERLVLGNLDAQRDFGWAPDYVDAMVRAASHVEPGNYVISTGTTHSIRDFAATAFSSAGIENWEDYVDVDSALVRPADPMVQVGDSSLAHRVLGWQPTVGFEEMIRRMVQADLNGLTDP